MSLLNLSSRYRQSLLTLSITCALASVAACASTDRSADAKTSHQAEFQLFESDLRGAHMLVFSKTAGWRHDSIPAGIEAMKKLADQYGFTVEATEDASVFTDENLKRFNTLVFVNTTGDILNEAQEIAMERFIQAGGGFAGIHAAADTETGGEWYWYRRLVGGVFKSHPGEPDNVQHAHLQVLNPEHPATRDVPRAFDLTDEWYDYLELYPYRRDLLTLDENSYIGGLHGHHHPISWYHQFDGGRAFYTGLGHTSEMFSEPHFTKLLVRGLRYATGGSPKLDYSKARATAEQVVQTRVNSDLKQPVALDFLPDGQLLVAEGAGAIKQLNANGEGGSVIATLPVSQQSPLGHGLRGLAVSPDFAKDQRVYVSYLQAGSNNQPALIVSHFTLASGQLSAASEKRVIEIPLDNRCCHAGGDLAFDGKGHLFIATGDNAALDKAGFNLIEQDGKNNADSALRTSANTADLRGKVLRIIPGADGGYSIPEGNLYSQSATTLPEIYAMGVRDPAGLEVDTVSGALYIADRGPSATADDATRGPRGYDEVTRVNEPANLGWPFMAGNNMPYVNFNATRNDKLRRFNPRLPENILVEKGLAAEKILTPAKSALVWYGSEKNRLFPDFGEGERAVLVAGVYQQPQSAAATALPSYYNDKLVVLDAKRGWVQAVTQDEFARVIKIENLLPAGALKAATAAKFSPSGELYVLQQNNGAGELVKICVKR